MKKTVAGGLKEGASDSARALARQSALALLDRSIALGHDRLAVMRLEAAVGAGAAISDSQWTYCEEAFRRVRDPRLFTLLLRTQDRLTTGNQMRSSS